MKALVIPDIHLKPWLFDRAEKILNEGKDERAVCLMDIPDDWNMEFNVIQYRDTFDRAISFAKTYPETLLCYGNHDVSYPWGKLETGYSPYAERTVISKLDELKDSLQDKSQIAFIHRIDNVLFMHGGLTAEYVSRLNPELLDADIDEVLEAVMALLNGRIITSQNQMIASSREQLRRRKKGEPIKACKEVLEAEGGIESMNKSVGAN